MSAERGESDPQEWPTYPGGPSPSQPQWSQPPRANPPKPTADPDPEQGEYQYQPFQHHPWKPVANQQQQPYPAPYQRPKPADQWLRNKWLWIIGGLIAVFVILGIFREGGGFPIMPVIFGLVVWQILRHRRRP